MIDQEVIQTSGARGIRDLLRTVPRRNLTRGNDGNSGVSFRGLSSSRTLRLIDGKRVSTRSTLAPNCGGDLKIVARDANDRIEVVLGSMSMFYGSDVVGGVIKIIIRKGTEIWSGSVTTEFGIADESTTADSRSISRHVSGPLRDNLGLSAGRASSTRTRSRP